MTEGDGPEEWNPKPLGVVWGVEDAKRYLKAMGYVVLKEKSHRQAQERQRVAEARARYEEDTAERNREWVRGEMGEMKRLERRCTFLYGECIARGAAPEELRGTC